MALNNMLLFNNNVEVLFVNHLLTVDLVEECEKNVINQRLECVGGGRIRHDPDNKNITVYGYSVVSTTETALANYTIAKYNSLIRIPQSFASTSYIQT